MKRAPWQSGDPSNWRIPWPAGARLTGRDGSQMAQQGQQQAACTKQEEGALPARPLGQHEGRGHDQNGGQENAMPT
jgi:hypothetical protein